MGSSDSVWLVERRGNSGPVTLHPRWMPTVPAVAEALFARCVEGVILAEASSNILGLLLRLCCWMGLELAGVGDTPSANSLGATPGASRLIVLWITAKLLAIAVQASPVARRASASARWCAVSAGFRPPVRGGRICPGVR
jgi:hypothetical protein